MIITETFRAVKLTNLYVWKKQK